MGMPFRQSQARSARGDANRSIEWCPENDREGVTITLDAAHLQRLLRNRLLYVEDFYCADDRSLASVRRMLLRLVAE